MVVIQWACYTGDGPRRPYFAERWQQRAALRKQCRRALVPFGRPALGPSAFLPLATTSWARGRCLIGQRRRSARRGVGARDAGDAAGSVRDARRVPRQNRRRRQQPVSARVQRQDEEVRWLMRATTCLPPKCPVIAQPTASSAVRL